MFFGQWAQDALAAGSYVARTARLPAPLRLAPALAPPAPRRPQGHDVEFDDELDIRNLEVRATGKRDASGAAVFELHFESASGLKVVERRWDQIAHYHRVLAEQFPEVKLPAFPGEGLFNSGPLKTTDREKSLEAYLRALGSIPSVAKSFSLSLFFDDVDLNHKTAVVTGASSGIGLELARLLLRLGCRVIFACRDAQKTHMIVEGLKRELQTTRAEFIPLDLSRFSSIDAFVKEFTTRKLALNYLVLNAGLIGEGDLTEQGFEPIFGVNFLGHFLLLKLLLPLLINSSPSRVVAVASQAHYHRTLPLNFTAPTLRVKLTGFEAVLENYIMSKAALVLLVLELSERLKGSGVVAFAVDPGASSTGLFRNLPALVQKALPVVSKHAEFAALSVAQILLHPQLAEASSGRYFDESGVPRAASVICSDLAMAHVVWTEGERLLREHQPAGLPPLVSPRVVPSNAEPSSPQTMPSPPDTI